MMEGGGRQSRLLSRILGKLRGDHQKYNVLEKQLSISSSGNSESVGCGSATEEDLDPGVDTSSSKHMDTGQFAANIDLRYGGQYLTREQLPEFCDQLHHLVEVIRNIQSYSKVTGEYPSELERRLEQEAREVASLAAEVRNARDVVSRVKMQRKAVREHRKEILAQLKSLRETETRELESTIRMSDRKLFKNWEAIKDSADPTAFEPLLEEIRNKQTALQCLVRLIDFKRSNLAKITTFPQPLPPPEKHDSDDAVSSFGRKRHENGRRTNCKRRRKDSSREARSMPLSNEPSHHGPLPQVTLFIQSADSSSNYRSGSAGTVEVPTAGSVRDILFFTTS